MLLRVLLPLPRGLVYEILRRFNVYHSNFFVQPQQSLLNIESSLLENRRLTRQPITLLMGFR